MLTAAANAALENKVLVEEPHGSSAAGPFQVMLTEDLVWLLIPQPTPTKKICCGLNPASKHKVIFSDRPEVLISDLLDD